MLFQKWGCLVGPENSIFRKLKSVDRKKIALTTEIILHFHFHFKVFSEKERERERERESACARGEDQSAPISSPREDKTSPTTAIDASRDRAVDRDLAFARSRWIEIAIDGAISRSRHRKIATLIAISPSQDRASEIAISDRDRVFWICVFLSSFPNTRKYFPENFLKCNQTHRNIFLFRKLTFPKNMYFSENVLQQPNTALVSNWDFYFVR